MQRADSHPRAFLLGHSLDMVLFCSTEYSRLYFMLSRASIIKTTSKLSAYVHCTCSEVKLIKIDRLFHFIVRWYTLINYTGIQYPSLIDICRDTVSSSSPYPSCRGMCDV